MHFLYANSYEREAAAQLFEKWLETHPMPQALFTTSFPLLQGVMDVTLRREGKLPSELAIATFGDNELLDFLQCPVFSRGPAPPRRGGARAGDRARQP